MTLANTAPELRREGGDYILSWEQQGLLAVVRDIHDGRDGPRAEVTLRHSGGGHVHSQMLNLLSGTQKQGIVKTLDGIDRGMEWRALIEQLSVMVVEAHRRGAPLTLLEPRLRSESDAFLLHPLLPAGVATLLYGDGAAGKSYLAAAIARALTLGGSIAGMAARESVVAYLDWEWDEDEHADRMYRLGADAVCFYRQCTTPLANQTRALHRMFDQNGVQIVIVDSLGYACSGDIRDPDVVMGFFQALRQLGRTSLVIHHVPKESKEPYGSVYVRNSVRSAWYMMRSMLPEEGGFSVALKHNKSNRGPLLSPIGLQFSFAEQRTEISRADAARVPELVEGMGLRYRIMERLKRGKATAQDMADDLDVSLRQVQVRLSEMKRAGTIDGAAQEWWLLDRMRSQ